MRTELAFGQKKWAVVGATPDESKFGNKIYKMLKNAGFIVYPVNARYEEILGDKCYKSLHELPEKVDMVSIVVRPDIAEGFVQDYDAVFWFQPNTYTEETLAKVKNGRYIAGPCVLVEHGKAEAKIKGYAEKIVEWIRTKVSEANAKGVVLGISGGVDSAVVGALAKRAFPDASTGLVLPCMSSESDEEHAKKFIDSSGLSCKTIDIGEPHRFIMNAFGFGEAGGALRASDSNLRARLRMSAIYAYANYHGYLTLGTDNAAELLIGYFTKYGDGGVDLLPIAELLKCEVFHMARQLGVPRDIIYKAPSAGLWDGQTDEGEIGTTYDVIDSYLLGEKVAESDMAIIERMNRSSEHKRTAPPHPELK